MVVGAIAELGGAAAVEIAASALAERGAKPGMCHNCGVSVIADYCALCGQERDSHRRSLGALMHEVVREVASFDSRILRTAGEKCRRRQRTGAVLFRIRQRHC